jgi:hypothetical protein
MGYASGCCLFVVLAAGAAAAAELGELATTPAEDGWEEYVEPLVLEPGSVEGLAPGQSSPEAAVVHFYASRLRGDGRHEEVLPAERDSKLEYGLERMHERTLRKVTLLRRKQRSPGKYWIKLAVDLEIKASGKSRSGTNEISVERDGEKWYVQTVPF